MENDRKSIERIESGPESGGKPLKLPNVCFRAFAWKVGRQKKPNKCALRFPQAWSPVDRGSPQSYWEYCDLFHSSLPSCHTKCSLLRTFGTWELSTPKSRAILCGCCGDFDCSPQNPAVAGERRFSKNRKRGRQTGVQQSSPYRR